MSISDDTGVSSAKKPSGESFQAHPPGGIEGVESDFAEPEAGFHDPAAAEGQVLGVEVEGVAAEEVCLHDAVMKHHPGGWAQGPKAQFDDPDECGCGDRLEIARAPVGAHGARSGGVLTSIASRV